jgi:hypothetical protein
MCLTSAHAATTGWFAEDFSDEEAGRNGQSHLGYYVGGEGLIVGDWKLVLGLQHTGPFGNNAFLDCGSPEMPTNTSVTGCLFDIKVRDACLI